ncbi:MAG: hypothetical protein DCC64_10520 [Planctomycetota bacterium]|nr:MAG: hypothetical protein DCC64_10520 [Planctomycetota bacterium]
MTASHDDDDKTITELGRAILKYMHQRSVTFGQRNASYRKTRIDMLRHLSGAERVSGNTGRFNWGFEAVFAQELHVLEELGLITVKYGSGAIMAGRTVGRKQIYGLFLTDDGLDTAKVIIEREGPLPSDASRPSESAGDDEEGEPQTESSTMIAEPKSDVKEPPVENPTLIPPTRKDKPPQP